MPRYVILRHKLPPDAGRPSHWDLMLETGDVLRTWALAREPDTPGTLAAEALADHRPHYLDYEGPVSGNRGHVARWDAGSYETASETSEELQIALTGSRLQGRAVLRRTGGDQRWEFTFISC